MANDLGLRNLTRKLPKLRLLAVFFLWLGLGIGAVSCSFDTGLPDKSDKITLTATGFSSLPGWDDDAVSEALPALRKSCASLSRQTNGTVGTQFWSAGGAADWLPICNGLSQLQDDNVRITSQTVRNQAARKFFERWFTPYYAQGKAGRTGLFTGYYEMEIEGAKRPDHRFNTALYATPPDLVTIDLGLFRPDLKGRKLSGRMVGKEMRPYQSRSEIEAGALDGRNLEIVYVSAVDAFFLAVQGSGRVILTDKNTDKNNDKKVLRLGYDGSNGQIYQSIGNELIRRGILSASEVTAAAIRTWLLNHVEQASLVMNANPSYVFFREIANNDEVPIGAAQVSLTPMRSLAIDPNFVPMGLPIWLDLDLGEGEWPSFVKDRHLRRLMVAQDTGGAIKGAVRGDVFCGHGDAAWRLAERLKHPGRYFLLLPKTVKI